MCYFVGKEGDWAFTSEDFKNLAEIEGDLRILVQCSTFSQHEKLHSGSLEVAVKKSVTSKLRSYRVPLTNLSNMSKSYKI